MKYFFGANRWKFGSQYDHLVQFHDGFTKLQFQLSAPDGKILH